MSSVQNTAEARWTRNWKNQRGCRSSYVLTGVRWSALLWGLFYPLSLILLLVPRRGFCGLAPEKWATATQGEEPIGVLCGGGGGGCVGWASVTRDRHRLSAHSGGEPSSQPAGLTGSGDWFKVSGGAKLGGCVYYWVCPSGSVGKVSACSVGDQSLIPGLGRSSGEGNGYPLQSSCLKNPMDRGAWWAPFHGVAELDMTEWLHFHFQVCLVPEVYSKMEKVPQTLCWQKVPLACSSGFTFSPLAMGSPSLGSWGTVA